MCQSLAASFLFLDVAGVEVFFFFRAIGTSLSDPASPPELAASPSFVALSLPLPLPGVLFRLFPLDSGVGNGGFAYGALIVGRSRVEQRDGFERVAH